MKYIRTYESVDIIYDFNRKIEKILIELFKDNKFIVTTINSSKVVLKEIDSRVKPSYYNYHDNTFLVINPFHLKDKKMRDIPIDERDKIGIYLSYNFVILKSQKEICENLTKFLMEIFTKYSYYKNHINRYNIKNNGHFYFYIKTSDIFNILYEIENNLEMYINMSKYNI